MIDLDKCTNDELRNFVVGITERFVLEDIKTILLEIQADVKTNLEFVNQSGARDRRYHALRKKAEYMKIKVKIVDNRISEILAEQKERLSDYETSKQFILLKALMKCFDEPTKKLINKQLNDKMPEFEEIIDKEIRDYYH